MTEARLYLDTVAAEHTGSAEDLRARISPPVIAAFLLAKQTIAAERDITLTVTAHSHPGTAARARGPERDDNPGQPHRQRAGRRHRAASAKTVTVSIHDEDTLTITVSDNGPRVPAEHLGEIFADGFTPRQ